MKVLVIDVGGTHVKVLATGQKIHREIDSGKHMTAKRMVADVRKLAGDWGYDAISIGYPGPVVQNGPALEPWNLGRGWVGFDFKKAFKKPVKVVNDAAMQALGRYRGGKMLFLGLGTGLGSAFVIEGQLYPWNWRTCRIGTRRLRITLGCVGLKNMAEKNGGSMLQM
jgi:polyphosphate glucokinase